jgi:hypothetical protein
MQDLPNEHNDNATFDETFGSSMRVLEDDESDESGYQALHESLNQNRSAESETTFGEGFYDMPERLDDGTEKEEWAMST